MKKITACITYSQYIDFWVPEEVSKIDVIDKFHKQDSKLKPDELEWDMTTLYTEDENGDQIEIADW
jgi:hypothetical protein